MSLVKVIEVIAQSDKSWEDATKLAYQEARKTVRNIQTIYVKNMQAIVEEDDRMVFRVNVKISFILEENH
jgi:flavin-binding protein dodecin